MACCILRRQTAPILRIRRANCEQAARTQRTKFAPSLRLNLPGVTYLLSATVGHHVPVVDLPPSGIVGWRRRCIGIVTIAIVGRRIIVSIGPAPIGVTPTPPTPAGKPKAEHEIVVAIEMMVPVVEVPVMRGSCSSMKTSSWSTVKAPSWSTVKAPRRSAMESTSASTTHLRVGWSSEQEQPSPCNCND